MLRVPPGGEYWFSLLLVALDALIIDQIFLLVFELWLWDFSNKTTYLSAYIQVRWWLFALFLGFGSLFDIFRLRSLRAASDVLSNTTATLLSTFLAFNLLVFSSRSLATLVYTFPRPIILFSTALSILGVFFTRIILSKIFKPYPIIRKAVIVGAEDEGNRILKHFHRRGGIRFKICGIFHQDRIEDLASFVIFRQIDEVIVTDPKIHLDGFWASIFYNRKIEPHPFSVRVVFDPGTTVANIGLKSLEDLPLVTVNSQPLTPTQRFMKRAFDVCFAVFAILISSPAMLLASILVSSGSPGPTFYKQKRVGRFGKEFDMVKFRTMHVGAEKGTGPKIATHDDPRTTKYGKYFRRFAIDELPQFFLVLTGEMSVVGPRPERPFFVQKHFEFQGRRLSVRPGVTGLAAVNSRYYLRLTDKTAYDYFYLDNYSLILDIKIIFQTIWVLVFESDKALEDHHHAMDKMEPPPENDDPEDHSKKE